MITSNKEDAFTWNGITVELNSIHFAIQPYNIFPMEMLCLSH